MRFVENGALTRSNEPGQQICVPILAHRFIAEGDHVVVEGRGQATTKAGKAYNNTYCWVYRIADGKVQELTEYMDTELVTAALDR